jgi:hypothetical protein
LLRVNPRSVILYLYLYAFGTLCQADCQSNGTRNAAHGVLDGVFRQKLEGKGRNLYGGGPFGHFPLDLKALTEALLLDL